MRSPDALDAVWHAYQVTTDCFRLAQRAIGKPRSISLERTVLGTLRRSSAERQIVVGRAQLDDLAVVGLWAAFERYLREFLRMKGSGIRLVRPRALGRRLEERTAAQMEYWRTDEVLDVLKAIVDPDLIVNAKQIKNYRDWVAHRNPRRPSPPQTDPRSAYAVMRNVLDTVRSTQRRKTRAKSPTVRRASTRSTRAS